VIAAPFSVDSNAAALVLAWLGQGLLFGTALAGLTWLLARVFRPHIRPAFEVVLWSIVLVKFLIPVGPQWSLSLASIWQTLSHHSTGALVTGDSPGVETLSDAALGRVAVETGSVARTPRLWHWTTFLAGAYFLGVVSLLIIRTRGYLALRARCRALPRVDERTLDVVRRVCRRLGVRRVPSTRISDECATPFVMGFLHPLLVLSRRQLVRPDELETVIVHEVTHLRRGDLLVRYLQWIAGTLLFFWPVVGWVNRRIDRAREHACDEWALRHGKLTAGEYARCLLKAVQPMRAHRLAYQPTCMAGNPTTIERRIDVILESTRRLPRRRSWGLLAAAFLIVWGGFALTGAADDKDNAKAKKTKYLATEEDMRQHAAAVYARVNEHAAGDLNGDGAVTKEECWAFVTAVVLQHPEAVQKEYPEADHNRDGKLDLPEAYQFVRGDYELEQLHKKAKTAVGAALEKGDKEKAEALKDKMFAAEMKTYHFILDRREALLAMANPEPSLDEVKAVAAEFKKFEAEMAAKKKAAAGLDAKKRAEEVAKLKAKIKDLEAQGEFEKAKQLRAKLAKIKAAEGEKTAKPDMEERAKKIEMLKEKIAQLKAEGRTEEAEKLKAKLAELESD
jgi:beta-lactamase regulating signal transducer with metallopeptidase domain